ncbi:MAG TPA: DUF1552 domain-containing protein [Polyangiaceae bacterium]|nr:DUF1552 domain-containing protein [Polyangiaceae bacterium]
MNRVNPPAINRRFFLKGVAGACVAAPFLSSVNEKLAKAQGMPASKPRRLVMMYTHNGCLTTRWFPQKEDGALQASDLTGTYLEVMAPYVSKLLLPRGFRSLNGYAVGQSIDPHDQACGSKLTCAFISDDKNRYATAESLDHTIAKQINPGDKKPMVLGVGAASTLIKEVISFSGPNTAFPTNVNPQSVYTLLSGVVAQGGMSTGGGMGTTSGGTGTTTGMTRADYLVAKGKSVIDLVSDDLQTYKRLNMSKADQSRIDAWLSLLRETETGVMNPAVSAACNAMAGTNLGISDASLTDASPKGPITAGNVLGPRGSAEGDANLATSFTKGGDMMMNLIALSMMCDVNRVFLLVYPGYVVFNWDGIKHTKEHHGLSHRTGDFSVGGNCFAGVVDMIAQIDKWYASKFARLVKTFNDIQEGDGTLLDNTATMWLPELSDGAAHNLNNLPILIAGSCGGYLAQGKAVNVEGRNIGRGNSESSCQNGGTIGNTGSTGGNVPINKLYVTLMNAVGCKGADGGPVTTFGKFDGSKEADGIKNPGEVASLKAAK